MQPLRLDESEAESEHASDRAQSGRKRSAVRFRPPEGAEHAAPCAHCAGLAAELASLRAELARSDGSPPRLEFLAPSGSDEVAVASLQHTVPLFLVCGLPRSRQLSRRSEFQNIRISELGMHDERDFVELWMIRYIIFFTHARCFKRA